MLELLKKQTEISRFSSCLPQRWRNKGKGGVPGLPSKRGTLQPPGDYVNITHSWVSAVITFSFSYNFFVFPEITAFFVTFLVYWITSTKCSQTLSGQCSAPLGPAHRKIIGSFFFFLENPALAPSALLQPGPVALWAWSPAVFLGSPVTVLPTVLHIFHILVYFLIALNPLLCRRQEVQFFRHGCLKTLDSILTLD